MYTTWRWLLGFIRYPDFLSLGQWLDYNNMNKKKQGCHASLVLIYNNIFLVLNRNIFLKIEIGFQWYGKFLKLNNYFSFPGLTINDDIVNLLKLSTSKNPDNDITAQVKWWKEMFMFGYVYCDQRVMHLNYI